MTDIERNFENAKGSLEVLTTLREEFAAWLGEANSEDQREILENVLGHVEGLGREYAKRLEDSEARLAALRAAH